MLKTQGVRLQLLQSYFEGSICTSNVINEGAGQVIAGATKIEKY